MSENFRVRRILKPWIVAATDCIDGVEVFQFDTRAEAVAFTKAERARWDSEMKDFYQRMAIEDGEQGALQNTVEEEKQRLVSAARNLCRLLYQEDESLSADDIEVLVRSVIETEINAAFPRPDLVK